MPANPASAPVMAKLPILMRATLDAGFGGTHQVAADGDRVQAPARVAQHPVHHEHDDDRPDDFLEATVAPSGR